MFEVSYKRLLSNNISCCVNYADNGNISESPVSPLLSGLNEETEADNRRERNIADDTGLSQRATDLEGRFYIFTNCIFHVLVIFRNRFHSFSKYDLTVTHSKKCLFYGTCKIERGQRVLVKFEFITLWLLR